MNFVYLLLTYNHEEFIEKAFFSTINQSNSNFELIISDDCSSDATYSLLESLVGNYQGDIKIFLRRTSENIGTISHLNYLVSKYPADYYILGSGDDLAHVDKARTCIDLAELGNSIVVSNPIVIDEKDNSVGNFRKENEMYDIYEAIKNANCGIFINAFSVDSYKIFGPIDTSLSCEDQSLGFRNFLMSDGIINQSANPLVSYRSHSRNQVKVLHFNNINSDVIEYLDNKIKLRINLLESWLKDSYEYSKKNNISIDIKDIISKLICEYNFYVLIDLLLNESKFFSRLKILLTKFPFSFKKILFSLPILISPYITGVFMKKIIHLKWMMKKRSIGY